MLLWQKVQGLLEPAEIFSVEHPFVTLLIVIAFWTIMLTLHDVEVLRIPLNVVSFIAGATTLYCVYYAILSIVVRGPMMVLGPS
jgi:hypothetical protein